MKGVFLDSATIDPTGIDFSRLTGELSSLTFFDQTQPQDIFERAQGAEIVVLNKVVLNKEVLEQMPTVRCICVTATGVDNIDVGHATRLGKLVCNVRGYATDSAVQHVLAMMLDFTSQLRAYHEAVIRDHLWENAPHFCLPIFPTYELRSKTLGILGRGQSGAALGKVAQALGMKVLFAERKHTPLAQTRDGYIPFKSVLQQSDFISLHCPLKPETHHMISSPELGLMKSTAMLINIARGKIIDEDALANALLQGEIFAAALDVLSEEPPTSANPLLSQHIPNLLITPHIAWNTQEARQRLVNGVADNIRAYIKGAPQNRVLVA